MSSIVIYLFEAAIFCTVPLRSRSEKFHASSIRDLLITQMEVTFSPLKRSLKTPKKVTGKNLVYTFFLQNNTYVFTYLDKCTIKIHRDSS